MANEEHLRLIKQGVDAWNKWRGDHGDTRPDLSGANFSGGKLIGANLIEADLRSANLLEANLITVNLTEANLSAAGAAASHLAAGDGASTLIARVVFMALTLASWALRPPSRKGSA